MRKEILYYLGIAIAVGLVIYLINLVINIPNNNGSYTAITLIKRGNGYVGPQGEFYPGKPTVEQLRALYGR